MASCEDGEIVIKFSHVTNTDKHPKGIAATLLAKRVNEEMNGKACMEVYPNSSLYDDNKVLESHAQWRRSTGRAIFVEIRKIHQKNSASSICRSFFNDVDAVERFQLSEGGQKLKRLYEKTRPARSCFLAQRHEADFCEQAAQSRQKTQKA